jgi:hypothetical protein
MKKMLSRPGTIRIVRKFLWFPKTLGYERRWLEYANIVQRLEKAFDGVSATLTWDDQCFTEETANA